MLSGRIATPCHFDKLCCYWRLFSGSDGLITQTCVVLFNYGHNLVIVQHTITTIVSRYFIRFFLPCKCVNPKIRYLEGEWNWAITYSWYRYDDDGCSVQQSMMKHTMILSPGHLVGRSAYIIQDGRRAFKTWNGPKTFFFCVCVWRFYRCRKLLGFRQFPSPWIMPWYINATNVLLNWNGPGEAYWSAQSLSISLSLVSQGMFYV